jgi:hypothetical protein
MKLMVDGRGIMVEVRQGGREAKNFAERLWRLVTLEHFCWDWQRAQSLSIA